MRLGGNAAGLASCPFVASSGIAATALQLMCYSALMIFVLVPSPITAQSVVNGSNIGSFNVTNTAVASCSTNVVVQAHSKQSLNCSSAIVSFIIRGNSTFLLTNSSNIQYIIFYSELYNFLGPINGDPGATNISLTVTSSSFVIGSVSPWALFFSQNCTNCNITLIGCSFLTNTSASAATQQVVIGMFDPAIHQFLRIRIVNSSILLSAVLRAAVFNVTGNISSSSFALENSTVTCRAARAHVMVFDDRTNLTNTIIELTQVTSTLTGSSSNNTEHLSSFLSQAKHRGGSVTLSSSRMTTTGVNSSFDAKCLGVAFMNATLDATTISLANVAISHLYVGFWVVFTKMSNKANLSMTDVTIFSPRGGYSVSFEDSQSLLSGNISLTRVNLAVTHSTIANSRNFVFASSQSYVPVFMQDVFMTHPRKNIMLANDGMSGNPYALFAEWSLVNVTTVITEPTNTTSLRVSRTVSPLESATATATAYATATATITPPTPSKSFTITPPPTPSQTTEHSMTLSETITPPPTPTPTSTESLNITATYTPPPTLSTTNLLTYSVSDTITPPPTPTATSAQSATLSATITPPPTPSLTPTATFSLSSTITPPPTPSHTHSTSGTTTATITPPPTPSGTSEVTTTKSTTITPPPSPTLTYTRTPPPTPTPTRSGTFARSLSQSLSSFLSQTVSATITPPPTPTATHSFSSAASGTRSPSATKSATTRRWTATVTASPSPSLSVSRMTFAQSSSHSLSADSSSSRSRTLRITATCCELHRTRTNTSSRDPTLTWTESPPSASSSLSWSKTLTRSSSVSASLTATTTVDRSVSGSISTSGPSRSRRSLSRSRTISAGSTSSRTGTRKSLSVSPSQLWTASATSSLSIDSQTIVATSTLTHSETTSASHASSNTRTTTVTKSPSSTTTLSRTIGRTMSLTGTASEGSVTQSSTLSRGSITTSLTGSRSGIATRTGSRASPSMSLTTSTDSTSSDTVTRKSLSLSPSHLWTASATSSLSIDSQTIGATSTLTHSETTSASRTQSNTRTSSATKSPSTSDSITTSQTDSPSRTSSASITVSRTVYNKSATHSHSPSLGEGSATQSPTTSPSISRKSYSPTTSSSWNSPTASPTSSPSASSSIGSPTSSVSESLTSSASKTQTRSRTSAQVSRTLSHSPTLTRGSESPTTSVTYSTSHSASPSASPSPTLSGGSESKSPSATVPTNSRSSSASVSVSLTDGVNEPALPFQRSLVIRETSERGRFNLIVKRSPVGAFPTPASPITTVHLQQAFTGDAFSVVTVGSSLCAAVAVSSNASCFGLQNCLFSPSSVVQFPVALATAPTTRFASGTLFALPVILPQGALRNSLCIESSVVAAAVVMSDAMIVTVPTYRFTDFFTVSSSSPSTVAPDASNDSATVQWLAGRQAGTGRNAATIVIADVAVATLQAGSNSSTGIIVSFTADRGNSSESPRRFNETSVPLLWAEQKGNVSSVACTISDVASFSRAAIPANTDLGGLYSLQCAVSGIATYFVDLQAACATDDLCLGFLAEADETPLCLLRAGRGFDAFNDRPRWLYLKASDAERTCSTRIGGSSGALQVYIRQTYFSKGTASVFVNGGFVTQCGGQRSTFVGGVLGRASACSVWLLCSVVGIPTPSAKSPEVKVDVKTSAAVSAGGCDAAVGVMFVMTFGPPPLVSSSPSPAPGSPPAPPPFVPSANLSVPALRVSFPNRLYLHAASRGQVSVFTLNTRRILLSVVQTGFDCSSRSCATPSVQLGVVRPNGTTTMVQTLQTCGGSSLFIGNQSGLSDQCESTRFCGFPLFLAQETQSQGFSSPAASGSSSAGSSPADSAAFTDGSNTWMGAISGSGGSGPGSSAPVFSGWLQIGLDIATIRAGSTLCPYFGGALYATSRQSDGDADISGLSGFVLHEAPGTFRTLVVPPAGTPKPSVAQLLQSQRFVKVPAIASLLSPGDMRDVYIANGTLDATIMLPNTSFGCVMDWISTDSAACTIPVPSTANFATVQVAQTNFASVQLTVEHRNGRGALLRSVICGGSTGFSGFTGYSDRCNLFLRCSSGFLLPNTTQLRLVVPSSAGNSKQCTAAFASTIDFSFVNRTAPVGCQFLCVSDRACVPFSAVCDGVVDCSDGADETPCNDWTLIEVGSMFFASPPRARVYDGLRSYRDCRNIAVANGTALIAITTNQSYCIVYGSGDAQQYVSNPGAYIEPDASFLVYARLGGKTYSRCSSATTCTGRGTVVVTAIGSRTLCTCTCDDGWTGADCSTKLSLAMTGPLVVVLNRTSLITLLRLEMGILSAFGNGTTSDITVTCSPFFQYKVIQLLTNCVLSGADPDTISKINNAILAIGALERLQEAMNTHDIVATGLTTQPFPRQSTCREDGTGSGVVVCSFGHTTIRTMRAIITTSQGIERMEINIPAAAASASGSSSLPSSAGGGSSPTRAPVAGVRRSAVVDAAAGLQPASSSNSGASAQGVSSFVCTTSHGLFNSSTSSGCVSSTCVLELAGLEVDTALISTPGITDQELQQDPCYVPLSVDYDIQLTVPLLERAMPENTLADYSPFLISGLVFISSSSIFLFVAAYMLHRHNDALRASMKHFEESHREADLHLFSTDAGEQNSEVTLDSGDDQRGDAAVTKRWGEKQMKTPGVADSDVTPLEALIRRACSVNEFYSQAQRIIRHEKWSAMLLVAAVDLTILGIFLTLYFSTSRAQNSNVQVILESYRTSECDNSQTAPLFTRVAVVDAWDAHVCAQRQAAGAAEGAIFAAAYCDSSSGNPLVIMKIASSAHDCETQDFVVYPLGACVPTRSLLPHLISDSSYISIDCGTIESVTARFGFAQSIDVVVEKESLRLDTVRSDYLALGINQSTPLGTFYTRPQVEASVIYNVSSFSKNRFESIASASQFTGPVVSSRFVSLDPVETFLESEAHPKTTQLEQSVSIASITPSQAALGPLNGDYPVGFIYNDFNGADEKPGASAGAGAARYYGVVRSLADLGLYYDAAGPDGTGFTISLYLRATRNTIGFAFAVADAREDMFSGGSPLLDRMLKMIANDSPLSAWYEAVYSLYSSLLVDGPGAALRFVFANAPLDTNGEVADPAAAASPVVNVLWDLPTLGLLRLFNGAWHHVAIILRNENRRIKAQLIVDGETSESVVGWNQCVARAPLPIQSLNASQHYTVWSAINERVMDGGVLFAGYLNGGVAHLEFSNQREDIFDLWRTSTLAIQWHNNINEVGHVTVAAFAYAAGLVMLVVMILTSGGEIWELQDAKREEDRAHCKKVYVALWKQQPRDAQGNRYVEVSFENAKAWVNLDDDLFTVFLEQLKYNFKSPAEELVRLMFAIAVAVDPSQPDLSEKAPSSTDWMILVEEDELERHNEAAYDASMGWSDDRPPTTAAKTRRLSQRNVLVDRTGDGGERSLRAVIVPETRQADSSLRAEGAPLTRLDIDDSNEAANIEMVESTIFGDPSDESGGSSQAEGQSRAQLSPVTAVPHGNESARFSPSSSSLALHMSNLRRKRLAEGRGDAASSFRPVGDAVAEGSVSFDRRKRPGEKRKESEDKTDHGVSSNTAGGGGHVQTDGLGAGMGKGKTPAASGGGNTAGEQQKLHGGDVPSSPVGNTDLGSDLTEMLHSLVFVMQSVSVWLTTMDLPRVYFSTFSASFSLFSADLSQLLQASPLVTPILQFSIAMLLFAILFYFIEEDEQSFLQNVSRYAFRRDELYDLQNQQRRNSQPKQQDGLESNASFTSQRPRNHKDDDEMVEDEGRVIVSGAHRYHHVDPDARHDFFGEDPDTGIEFAVPILPLSEAQRIDTFLGRISVPHHQDLSAHQTLLVKDHLHREYRLQKNPKKNMRNRRLCENIIVRSAAVATTSLREVGHCCPQHEGRELATQMQSDVWPFESRPSCCVEINGRRCGTSVGPMFVCGFTEEEVDGVGKRTRCSYALCKRHYSANILAQLLAPVRGMYRAAMSRGSFWVIVSIALAIANIGYTPFMKTALLIVGCDPYYQCDFLNCWKAPDRLFVLAAYLCTVMIVGYGIGFPFAMFALLHRRHAMLELIFFSEEYGDRFKNSSSSSSGEGATPSSSSSNEVKMLEWRRFVVTDPTALGKLYQSYEMQWIYIAPVMLFWKAATLAPVVFLERDSFNQLLGIVTVQLLFGIFLFATEPSISPTVDLMFKMGSAHQMILLGTLALNRYQRYRGGATLDNVAIAVTLTYLLLCLLCMGLSTIVPIFAGMLSKARAKQLLQRMGMQYSETTAMYVVPIREPVFRQRQASVVVAGEAEAAATTVHDQVAMAADVTLPPAEFPTAAAGNVSLGDRPELLQSVKENSTKQPFGPVPGETSGSGAGVSAIQWAGLAESAMSTAKEQQLGRSRRTSFTTSGRVSFRRNLDDDSGEGIFDDEKEPADEMKMLNSGSGGAGVQVDDVDDDFASSFTISRHASSMRRPADSPSGLARRPSFFAPLASLPATEVSRVSAEEAFRKVSPALMQGMTRAGFAPPSGELAEVIGQSALGKDIVLLGPASLSASNEIAAGQALAAALFANALSEQPLLAAGVQRVVLCPTPAQSMQLFDHISSMAAFMEPFGQHALVHLCSGQNKLASDIRTLHESQAPIVVGTLMRVHDLIVRGAIRPFSLKTVVLYDLEKVIATGSVEEEREGPLDVAYKLLQSVRAAETSQRIVLLLGGPRADEGEALQPSSSLTSSRLASRRAREIVERFLRDPVTVRLKLDDEQQTAHNQEQQQQQQQQKQSDVSAGHGGVAASLDKSVLDRSRSAIILDLDDVEVLGEDEMTKGESD